MRRIMLFAFFLAFIFGCARSSRMVNQAPGLKNQGGVEVYSLTHQLYPPPPRTNRVLSEREKDAREYEILARQGFYSARDGVPFLTIKF